MRGRESVPKSSGKCVCCVNYSVVSFKEAKRWLQRSIGAFGDGALYMKKRIYERDTVFG